MYNFGGIYLVKFIHLKAPYIIFDFGSFWGSFFGVFLGFGNFQKLFWNENVILGGIFREI